MRYFNRFENPNAIAGLFLLILLAVFAGPNILPRLISEAVPFADEGVPCRWLRTGDGRALHQSLIGRSTSARVDSPLTLTIETDPYAGPLDTDQLFQVTIKVYNDSLGTVGIIVTPEQIIIGGNSGESGLGISFGSAPVPAPAQTAVSYPESQIRLPGPRQLCIHRVSVPIGQLDSSLATGDGLIRAFYRNASRGAVAPTSTTPPIYTDQGLWVGVVESDPVNVPVDVTTQ